MKVSEDSISLQPMYRQPEYAVFKAAKARCNNPNAISYPNYGARGIEFRFTSFAQFQAEIGRRPSDAHTLERINNDGHYELGNVRWATRKEQGRNVRHNRNITINGQTRCLAEWFELSDLKECTIRGRQKLGWCDECAITKPLRQVCSHRSDDWPRQIKKRKYARTYPKVSPPMEDKGNDEKL